MNHYIIDGLTRTGSTTLARVLACHTQLSCLIEPFHPKKHRAEFNLLALNNGSAGIALQLIFRSYRGVKHVWEAANSWPFVGRPDINDSVVTSGNVVISLSRRNLLQRYVSGVISRQLMFWVGSREEFLTRLEKALLPEFDPDVALREIRRDSAGIARRRELLQLHSIPHTTVDYEDFFSERLTLTEQKSKLWSLIQFLDPSLQVDSDVDAEWTRLLDRSVYQWHSEELYTRIPGLRKLNEIVGSDEMGWLFT